jgi:hypothetical protein
MNLKDPYDPYFNTFAMNVYNTHYDKMICRVGDIFRIYFTKSHYQELSFDQLNEFIKSIERLKLEYVYELKEKLRAKDNEIAHQKDIIADLDAQVKDLE